MAAAALVLTGATVPMSTPHLALNLPVFAPEMVLAAWLIARGFSSRAVVAVSTPVPAMDPSLAGAGARS